MTRGNWLTIIGLLFTLTCIIIGFAIRVETSLASINTTLVGPSGNTGLAGDVQEIKRDVSSVKIKVEGIKVKVEAAHGSGSN